MSKTYISNVPQRQTYSWRRPTSWLLLPLAQGAEQSAQKGGQAALPLKVGKEPKFSLLSQCGKRNSCPLLPTYSGRDREALFTNNSEEHSIVSQQNDEYKSLGINQPTVRWPKNLTSISIPISVNINKFQTISLYNLLMQLVFRLKPSNKSYWLAIITLIITHSNKWLWLTRQVLITAVYLPTGAQAWYGHVHFFPCWEEFVDFVLQV